MEALVRYPMEAAGQKNEDEFEFVKKRVSRLQLALAFVLSFNLALAFGAVTLAVLLMRERLP